MAHLGEQLGQAGLEGLVRLKQRHAVLLCCLAHKRLHLLTVDVITSLTQHTCLGELVLRAEVHEQHAAEVGNARLGQQMQQQRAVFAAIEAETRAVHTVIECGA